MLTILIISLLIVLLLPKFKRKPILKKHKLFFIKGSLKSKIDCYEERITCNLPKRLAKINFNLLISAGVFKFKEIFKIYLSNFNFEAKKELSCIKNLLKKLNFTCVIVCANKNITYLVQEYLGKIDNVIIYNKEDINFDLLFEINKININYPVQEEEIYSEGVYVNKNKIISKYVNFSLEGECKVNDCEIKYSKFIEFANQSLFNSLNFNEVHLLSLKKGKGKTFNIVFVFKLKNQFFNLTKIDKKIVVNYADGQIDFFVVSTSNFNFFVQKTEKFVFLCVKFEKIKFNSNSYSNLCIYSNIEKILNLSNFKVENYLKIISFFNCNFASSNNSLNNFFKEMPKYLVKNLLLSHDGERTIATFDDIKNISKFSTPKFLNQLISEYLGIKFFDGRLTISPKLNISNFSFCLNFKNKKYNIEYKKSNLVFIKVNEVKFVNLKCVDLNSLNSNDILFCG